MANLIQPCEMDKILLFGDSITQMCFNIQETTFDFGAALVSDYQRRMDIIHRGYGGYTSVHARLIIGPILKALSSVKLTVVFYGTNDSCVTGPQVVPIEQYKENMKEIVKTILEAGSRLILVGPAPMDENVITDGGRSTFSQKKYCDAAGELAKEFGLGYVPLWYEFAKSVGWEEGQELPGAKSESNPDKIKHLLTDGLHFTGKGYQIYYNALKQVIAKTYPEFISDSMPMKWPAWDEIDLEDPKKSFK